MAEVINICAACCSHQYAIPREHGYLHQLPVDGSFRHNIALKKVVLAAADYTEAG